MKKQAQKIAEIDNAFWKTENGRQLAEYMHGDGQYASDYLGGAGSAILSAAKQEPEGENRDTLNAAAAKVKNALDLYYEAVEMLRKNGF